MALDFEMDRQVIHQAMAELEWSVDLLEDRRKEMVRLEEASFGDSELGLSTQAHTEVALAAVQETVASLRAVHRELVAALVTMQAQAEAADAETTARVDQLRRATDTPATAHGLTPGQSSADLGGSRS